MAALALGVLAAAGSAFAQEPTPPESPEARLDRILAYREQVAHKLMAFDATCRRTCKSARFVQTVTFEGTVRLLRTETAVTYGSLDLFRKGDPTETEKMVVNERGLWFYDPVAKAINLIDPRGLSGEFLKSMFDEPPLALIFGMKGADAKKRLDIQLKGEDDNYFYLEMLPRTAADKANFKVIRISLVRTTYLPAQIWWQQANDDEVQWDVTRIDPIARHLRPADFTIPETPPAGWVIAVPKAGESK
jgi:TIGR03009 family protein